jgi:NADPH:quinone reductase-like Zn-dependent oxidoreductase
VEARTLETRRDAWDELRIVSNTLPDELTDGQVLLEVDRFALTTNNITYCQVGDLLGYWRFFPTDDEAWGRVPAMGYATVAASAHPDVQPGERVWGFFPLSTHLLIQAGKTNPYSFTDVSPHREGLAPIYSQFQRAAHNPIYEEAREEQDSLLRGLYLTSFLCEDFLYDNDFYGAQDCLITSASSKTSIALAHAVKARGALRSIALTSARNREFCRGLGCYDEVFTYDDIESLPASRAAVIVDMAGATEVNAAVHHHYGDQLRYDCRIGSTHQGDSWGSAEDLPGPKPAPFFAPAQAGKRAADWGPEDMEQRIAGSFAGFRQFADSWLQVRRFDGEEAAREAFLSVLRGEASPAEGYTVSLRES